MISIKVKSPVPRSPIRIKRRKVRKTKQRSNPVDFSKSRISAAVKNNTELTGLDKFDAFKSRKLGISDNLAEYSQRQDSAFQKTFKTNEQSSDQSLIQASKQKAFYKYLKEECYFVTDIFEIDYQNDELLKPTKIYVKEILELHKKNLINGCANITGGGIVDNIKRVIPGGLRAEINLNQVKTLSIFKWIKKNNIQDKEMLKTFNCGVGFCLIIDPKKINQVKRIFSKQFQPYVIGKIAKGTNKIKLNEKINWS